ncbi:hypothetical protein WAK64_02560 [Bacillus spongiae]|uniref:Spore coat protein n=1 Tax=Bacillus spongiae TaxID=2683610 RepID=A0ABU8H9F3_9BACI
MHRYHPNHYRTINRYNQRFFPFALPVAFGALGFVGGLAAAPLLFNRPPYYPPYPYYPPPYPPYNQGPPNQSPYNQLPYNQSPYAPTPS